MYNKLLYWRKYLANKKQKYHSDTDLILINIYFSSTILAKYFSERQIILNQIQNISVLLRF